MIVIYSHTETKLGFIYIRNSIEEYQHLNIYETFKNKHQLKSFLHEQILLSLKVDIELFKEWAASGDKSASHLDRTSLNNIERLHQWIFKINNKGEEKTLKEIKDKVLEFKPFFSTIVKSADKKIQKELILLYKAIINEAIDKTREITN